MKMKKIILPWFVFFILSTLNLSAQKTLNSPFWEKVDNKIINPYEKMPTTLDNVSGKIITFAVNENGAMIVGCKGQGWGMQDEVVYISNDGGKTWEWLSPMKKYKDFYITTPFISVSGKYFVTKQFGTYSKEIEPFYLLSTDGKNWEVINKGKMMDRQFYGHNDESLVEVKNGKLSDYINENRQKLRRIFYPDGSVKVDRTSNVFYYNKETGKYTRNKPTQYWSSEEWTSINDVYLTCDGKYYTYAGSGTLNLISDDDIEYRPLTTNFFNIKMKSIVPLEDVRYYPMCNVIFGVGRTPKDTENKLYVQTENGKWEDTGFYSGGNIIYNPKTKRFYQFSNPYNYNTMQFEGNLVQSKKTYECDCNTAPQESEAPCSFKEGSNIQYVLSSEPPIITQPNDNTCWAAVATMMYLWKNGENNGDESDIKKVLAKISPSKLKKYEEDLQGSNLPLNCDGLCYHDQEKFFNEELGLFQFTKCKENTINCNKPVPSAYEIQKLLCTYGPLVLQYPLSGMEDSKSHVIIIFGIIGDGNLMSTKILWIEPLDGTRLERIYGDFYDVIYKQANHPSSNDDTYNIWYWPEGKHIETILSDEENNKFKTRVAVYFCSETGYYGYCYGNDEVETCARNNCIRVGGRNPKQIGGAVRNRGYGAIAIAKSANGKPEIGVAAGCNSQAEADQKAIDYCKQYGGQNPKIDARFLDDNPENGNIQETTSNQWTLISKSNNTQKIYNEKDKLWAIGLDNRIYFFNGQGWTAYPGGGQAVDIAVNNGIPYVIGIDSYIYKGTGNGWVQLDEGGTGKSIFCDKGTIWVIGSDDAIYSFKNNEWTMYPGDGLGFDIAAGNGVPYVVGLDNVIYKGNGSGWTSLGGQKGKRIFYESGKVWIIGIDDNIYYHDGSKWVLYPGNGKGIDISVANGIPYVVGQDNAIYKGK